MNRTEKTTVVESLADRFRATPHLILADYKGMTANALSAIFWSSNDILPTGT